MEGASHPGLDGPGGQPVRQEGAHHVRDVERRRRGGDRRGGRAGVGSLPRPARGKRPPRDGPGTVTTRARATAARGVRSTHERVRAAARALVRRRALRPRCARVRWRSRSWASRSCCSAPRAGGRPRSSTAAPIATSRCREATWWTAPSSAPTTGGATAAGGACVTIPSLCDAPPRIAVPAYPVTEADGFVWIFMGRGAPAGPPRPVPAPGRDGLDHLRHEEPIPGGTAGLPGELPRLPAHRLRAPRLVPHHPRRATCPRG